MPRQDTSLLEAALVGYRNRRAEIDTAIASLKARISGYRGDSTAGPSVAAAPVRKSFKFSAAARKRMAEAQRKRWAKARKKKY